MIDFRYHLVSLIAVFLAVALGIVIGTTQLNDPILADIEGQVTQLEQDKRALEDRTRQLEAQLTTAQEFEQAVAGPLVQGSLAESGVLLVVTDEGVAPETVEEVSGLIAEAGGTVTGTLRLEPAYSDPSTAAGLRSYITGSGLPPGAQLPPTDDAGELVGSLLGQVLMVPSGPDATAPDAAAVSSVLAGLVALEVLTVEGDSVTPADYVVVLTGGAFEGDDAADRVGTLVELVTALDGAGAGAVVAGNSSTTQPNGLVGALRADPELSAAVSTVDNVGSPVGRIATVLALGQEREGTSGRYGTAEDAQPVPPVPASTP